MLIYLQRLLPSPKHQSSLSPFPARPQGFQSQTSLAAAVVDAALENYHRQMLCPSPVSLLGGDLSTLFINHTATHFAVPRMLAMHISAVQKSTSRWCTHRRACCPSTADKQLLCLGRQGTFWTDELLFLLPYKHYFFKMTCAFLHINWVLFICNYPGAKPLPPITQYPL